jgi:hypothetical protein
LDLCTGNNEVIYEKDTSEDEYMFSGEGMLNTTSNILESLYYYFTKLLMLQIKTEWEPELEIEIKEDNESNKPDPYDDVYRNIPKTTHMLKTEKDCTFCGAKKFQYETKGLCCKNGNIKLANPETTPELMRLWTSNDSDARYFRDHIRFFNGHFSFTTLYCQLDRDTTDIRTAGIYTFRAHGQIYHNLHSFLNSRSDPKHPELYFYDDDPSLEHRYRRCRKETYEQDKHVVRIITGILRNNPYSEQFRSLGQAENLDDYRLILNLDQRLDQRRYNAPITSEVAAVWVEGNQGNNTFVKNVVLHGNNKEIQSIKAYYGCYDPLSYPLFFPRGELGWHRKIPKANTKEEDVRKADAAQDNDDDENPGKYFTYCSLQN